MTINFPGREGPMEAGAAFEDPYVLWDAAYVLGSLSSAERREFENHMSACPSCRAAVSELSVMPALLALMDRDDMIRAEDDLSDEPPPLRPEVLTVLLEKVSWRRRRSRWATWAVGAAAAVVLALGLFVAFRPGAPALLPPPERTSATALAMTPVVPSELDATVTLSSHGWGTHVEMKCLYRGSPGDADRHDDDAGDKLAMVAVGRDGTRTQLATWMALPAATAVPSGSTSMPIDEIAAVQIVSADTGDVLMQRTL